MRIGWEILERNAVAKATHLPRGFPLLVVVVVAVAVAVAVIAIPLLNGSVRVRLSFISSGCDDF